MPEISALLHDAVPPDEGGPDLDEIAHLAGRRRSACVVFSLAVVAIVAGGLSVIGGDDHPDGRGDDVIIVDGTTTTTTMSGPTGLGAPSPTSFGMRLGTRPLTRTTSFPVWPLTPDELFEVPPDQAVVGTLVQVRPGAVLPDSTCHSGSSPEGCTEADAEVLETGRSPSRGGSALCPMAPPMPKPPRPTGAPRCPTRTPRRTVPGSSCCSRRTRRARTPGPRRR